MKTSAANIKIYDASRNAFGIFKNSGVLAQLAGHGIALVHEPRAASILVGETRRQLQRNLFLSGGFKRCFLYTDEPGFDCTDQRRAWLIPSLKRFDVMNVYTGEVFTDASAFIGAFGLSQPLPPITSEAELRRRFDQKRTAAFLTYRPAEETRRFVAGRNVDLNALRISLALAGHARGVVDIYGAGFAPGIVKDSTGWGTTAPGEEWWDVKHRMLTSHYAFNLCSENTDWPNYITEKIWQSIRADCLPIYLGKNNGVRALFPPNSYLEISDFSVEAELFDFIASLTFDEFLERLNKCRATYQRLLGEFHAERTDSYSKRIDRLAHRLLAAAVR